MAKLYFRYGTMNSSKSAQLLMVNHNYISSDKHTLVFKPLLDTRSGGHVVSRALSDKVEAIQVAGDNVGGMFALVSDEKPTAVLVDEVQFMQPSQIDELVKIVDLLGIPVMCYGLMTDFQGNIFNGSKRLVEVGAKLEEVKTVCVICDKKAQYNMRLLDGEPVFDGEQVQIGGNESYKAVCRCCYNALKSGEVTVERAHNYQLA